MLRPGLAGGCINLWSAYLKDAQEGSGRRRRGKGLLDLEDVSLARGGREVVGTEDLLGGIVEGSGSHDFISRASSSSLPVWTPQPLQAASRAERSARSIIQSLPHLSTTSFLGSGLERDQSTPNPLQSIANQYRINAASIQNTFPPFCRRATNAFPAPSCGSDSCVYDNGT